MTSEEVSLRKRVFRAGAWSLVGYAVGFAIRLGSNLVMTRLLAPSMFGVVAIAQLIMVGLALFSDIGLKPSVVQSRRGSEPDFLNTVWTIQILRGIGLYLAAAIVAGLVYLGQHFQFVAESSVYGATILPSVIGVASIAAIVAGFESTKSLQAARALSLGSLTAIDLFSQIVGLAVMIVWAVVNPSIWVLVAGSLASVLARTLASHVWLGGVSNRWGIEGNAVREILSFGKWIFLSSLLFFLASNGDRIILGGLVDADRLGTYVVAYLMFSSLEQVISKIIVDVSFPALSEIIRNRPLELTKSYYKFHARIASFTYFCSGVLFVSGESVVRLLYDARYAAAGGILEILSIALVTVPVRIATQAFLALGVESVYFVINATRVVALFVALPVGYYFGGFNGAIWGIVFSYFSNVPMTIVYATRYGMFDVRREIVALTMLVPGFAAGTLAKLLFNLVAQHLGR